MKNERLQKWVRDLSYDDRLKIREFVIRLHQVSEEMRMEDKTFEERHGFTPDSDYEIRKCNKTPEEIQKIMTKNALKYVRKGVKNEYKD